MKLAKLDATTRPEINALIKNHYNGYHFSSYESDAFQLQAEDIEQINGYAEGLQREFPRAQIERYAIYCIGNRGFRVFPVA